MATLAEPDELEVSIVKENQLAPPKETARKTPKKEPKKPVSSRMKTTKKAPGSVPAQSAGKRPRGRPRKPRNNTADTAIILSDDDTEQDDEEEAEQDDSLPKKVLWDTKKRSLGKVESPASAPSAKRHAPDSSAMREELDQVKEELASERELLSDCRAEKSRIQQLLEEKEASWAAELAVQMTPFQLQIQKLVQEREALESKCQDLQHQLQVALGNQQDDAQTSTDGHTGLGEDLASQVRHKNAVIASQRNDIAELEELEEEREKQLAEAHQKIALLTKTVNELTAQAKPPHEKDETIQQLQEDLVKSELLRSQAEERLVYTVKKLGQVEADLAKSEEKLATLKEQSAQDKVDGNNNQPAISPQIESEVKGLFIENTRLRSMVTALEKEKQELTEAYHDEGNLLKQLQSYKDSVESLQVERAQLLKSLGEGDDTIARLRKDLACQMAASKQKVDSMQAQYEYERACREQQQDESVAQLELDLEAKDTIIQQLNAEIQQLRERLADAQNAASTQSPANNHNAEREELKNEIAAQGRMLAKIQDAATDCRTRLEKKSEAAIVALRNRVKNLIAEVQKSESTSAPLQADLRGRRAMLVESEGIFSAKKAAIKELQNIASSLTDEEKPKLKDDIADHEMKLRELAVVTLPDLATMILKSKTSTEAQNKAITSLKTELTSISRGRDYVAQEIAARLSTVKRLKSHLARSAAAIDRISAKVNVNIAMDLSSMYSNPLDELLAHLLAEKEKTRALITTLEAEFKALRSMSAAAVASMNGNIVDLPHRLDRLAVNNAEVEKAAETQGAEVKKLQAELAGLMALLEKVEEEVSGKDTEHKEKDGENYIQDKVKGLLPACMKC